MNGKIIFLVTLSFCFCIPGSAQIDWGEQVIEVGFFDDTSTYRFISDTSLYNEGWYLLPQVRFWRMVVNLDPEYSLLNIADTREVLSSLQTWTYDDLSLKQRRRYKDSVRVKFDLTPRTKLWVTQGRKDYYQIAKILPDIHRAIAIFLEENTDPWYAQSILLIESPGEMRVSPVGAKGPFQLMGEVAISVGLEVNERIDERRFFGPSARGAARYLSMICIPAARKIMEYHDIPYQENELWFRLFVLHIYHAGPNNMRRVMRYKKPKNGGMDLIQELWQTNYRSFGNASQNYSQITLAALLELEQIVYQKKGFFIPSP
ncbi:MAG: hypothetical protein AAF694_22030 [Bacteroidota bacterium]